MLRLAGKRIDHCLCRPADLRGCPQPRLAEDGSDFRLCVGISREHPYQLRAQPLEIGRQQNVGDAGAGMRHKLFIPDSPDGTVFCGAMGLIIV
jgi:hypothetical protein